MARKVVASREQSCEQATDSRIDRGHNHNLLERMFITIGAVICGADGGVRR